MEQDKSSDYMKFSDQLKSFDREFQASWGIQDPKKRLAGRHVRVYHISNLEGKAEIGKHEVYCDEPVKRGGTDKYPFPQGYWLSGLGFCNQALYVHVASRRGVSFKSLDMDIKGYWDTRPGEGYKSITIETRISSDETPDTISDLADRADFECPIISTLKRVIEIRSIVFLNGGKIRDTVYGPNEPEVKRDWHESKEYSSDLG